MNKIVAALLALSVAALAAAPMAAEAKSKKKRVQPYAGKTYSAPRSDYQEAIADKLPYGSSQWWAQMDREGRGGQSRPN